MIQLPTPTQAILIRVGADQTFGQWNAPCNPATGEFVYVPIPQNKPNAEGLARQYHPVISSALETFSARNGVDVRLPNQLLGRRMHLDPDFDYLSYGDTAIRGRRLLGLRENDWVVFYAGLRSVQGRSRLVYGLIGLLVVDCVRRVANIPAVEHDWNAHTRLLDRMDTDIVVVGKPRLSGRFSRYLEIGEFRDRSYRVRLDLLDAWGGLSVADGWIQRSANPPFFLEPARFAAWLGPRLPILQATNNPLAPLDKPDCTASRKSGLDRINTAKGPTGVE